MRREVLSIDDGANGAPVAVIEGEFTFKVTASPDTAPSFQVVAYAILPSQSMIAHSFNFVTEKCFSHSVSVCLLALA